MSKSEQQTIGRVCEINPDSYSTKESWSSFRYLDTGNITEGKIQEFQEIATAKDLPSRARRKVKDGDIVYSTVRPIQRHYGIIENPSEHLLVSTGFAVLRGKPGRADTNYIYYFLTQEAIVQKLQTWAEGSVSTYPSIKANDIGKLELKLPSIEEQRTIAHILSTLDDKIALNRKLNATLEAMAQALFQSWFVDFDPVKAKLAAVRCGRDPEQAAMAAIACKLVVPPGKPKAETLDAQLPSAEAIDAAIAALADLSEAQRQSLKEKAAHFPADFQESELGLIPQGWENVALYNTAEFVNGSSFKSSDFSSRENALPIIKIVELKQGISAQTKYTEKRVK